MEDFEKRLLEQEKEIEEAFNELKQSKNKFLETRKETDKLLEDLKVNVNKNRKA